MESSITIGDDGGVLTVRLRGPVTREEARAAGERLSAHTAAAVPPAVVIDASELDVSTLTSAEIEALAQHPVPCRLLAVVAETDLRFGLARMFELMHQEHEHCCRTAVFRTAAAALAWIAKGDISLVS